MEGGSHAEGEAAPLAEDDGGGGGAGGGDPGAARRKVARMKERRACIILGTYHHMSGLSCPRVVRTKGGLLSVYFGFGQIFCHFLIIIPNQFSVKVG